MKYVLDTGCRTNPYYFYNNQDKMITDYRIQDINSLYNDPENVLIFSGKQRT